MYCFRAHYESMNYCSTNRSSYDSTDCCTRFVNVRVHGILNKKV